jgi:hypothetical protein
MVDLAGLYLGIKRLPASVGWIEKDFENLVLVSPVEIDGVVVEGLRFRLTAMRSMPEEAVTCQLEYHERRRVGGPFCRVDWRPIHRHDNRAIGPPELRHRRFTGSHHHGFNINWTYAAAMVRRGNLPIVIPLDSEPQNFSELIAFLGKELRIENLSLVPRPPWQADLF